MGKRQKLWAKKARANLLKELGEYCVKCSEDRKWKLTFDCIEPRGDYHHGLGMDGRMSFYRKEHSQGNIQILCRSCNGRKGKLEDKICPF